MFTVGIGSSSESFACLLIWRHHWLLWARSYLRSFCELHQALSRITSAGKWPWLVHGLLPQSGL